MNSHRRAPLPIPLWSPTPFVHSRALEPATPRQIWTPPCYSGWEPPSRNHFPFSSAWLDPYFPTSLSELQEVSWLIAGRCKTLAVVELCHTEPFLPPHRCQDTWVSPRRSLLARCLSTSLLVPLRATPLLSIHRWAVVGRAIMQAMHVVTTCRVCTTAPAGMGRTGCFSHGLSLGDEFGPTLFTAYQFSKFLFPIKNSRNLYKCIKIKVNRVKLLKNKINFLRILLGRSA
jgi:hypothetical protein